MCGNITEKTKNKTLFRRAATLWIPKIIEINIFCTKFVSMKGSVSITHKLD